MNAANRDYSLFGGDHVRQYLETGGEVGHMWNGVTCLILFTVGHRTGKERATPLIYREDGDDVVVIASKGGSRRHPAWYRNLQKQPEAVVQVGPERCAVTARTAEGQERENLWDLMRSAWPDYDEYQERTDRLIPVVVLSPRAVDETDG